METIRTLTSALEGGIIPENYDAKAVKKLAKTWQKLSNPRVVRLYSIRRVAHDDSRYCVYACPFGSGTEIDAQTLQAITAAVDQVEVGEIRYDSMQAIYDYFRLTERGAHILDDGCNAITEISDRLDGILIYSKPVYSSRKAAQLDCHYAIVGLETAPDLYNVTAIPNAAIGEPPMQQIFPFDRPSAVDLPDAAPGSTTASAPGSVAAADTPESLLADRLKAALRLLSVIIMLGLLLWYYVIPLFTTPQ